MYFTLVDFQCEEYHNWIKHVNKFPIKNVIESMGKMSPFEAEKIWNGHEMKTFSFDYLCGRRHLVV